MQLTLYTDYSLRMLLYLGVTDQSATIGEIAERFQISRNHLVKVAHSLGKAGYLHTTRGRTGGLRLARSAEQINLGQVVRAMEPNFFLVECFNKEANRCVITPSCGLRHVLHEAFAAFLKVLDGYTLQDILANKDALAEELGLASLVKD